MSKTWIQLVAHKPDQDPRVHWIEKFCPKNISIITIGYDFENKMLYKQKKANKVKANSRNDFLANFFFKNEKKLQNLNEITFNFYLWSETENITCSDFKKLNKNEQKITLSKIKDICFFNNIVNHCFEKRKVNGIIASDFTTLFSSCLQGIKNNCPVIYDSHEFHSEEDHTKSKAYRDFWLSIEKTLVQYTNARFTVSKKLAQIASKKLNKKFSYLPNAEPVE